MALPKLTIGIEEEYQIIDPETRELRSYITEILQAEDLVLREVKPEPGIAFLDVPDPVPGAGEVRGGKLKDNRVIATVEPMHGNNAVVYTREGEEKWNRKVLDSSLADGHAVAFGDLLDTGMDQVVFGWRGKNADGKVGIKMFVPKSAEGKEWEEVWIDDNQMACEDLKLADLNNDGHLDIIAAGRATKNVKIYLNKGGF